MEQDSEPILVSLLFISESDSHRLDIVKTKFYFITWPVHPGGVGYLVYLPDGDVPFFRV